MERVSGIIGTAMIMGWTLVLGPIGVLLLACMAYAMVTGNAILGFICGLGALSPLFLTMLWGPVALMARGQKREREEQPSLQYLPAMD